MHPIKKYCQEQKIKCKEIAIKAGMKSVCYYYQILCGYRNPSAKVALKLSAACNKKVSPSDILYYQSANIISHKIAESKQKSE